MYNISNIFKISSLLSIDHIRRKIGLIRSSSRLTVTGIGYLKQSVVCPKNT